MKNYFCLILILLLSSQILTAQDSTDQKWTPEFAMQFKSISGTTVSPDGQYIAYVVREPVMEGEKSEYLSQIWVASADGKMNIQYTRGEKSSTAPAFSPDGKQIAFLSSRGEKTQIWLMRLMGGEAEAITDAKNGVSSFKWSPDGKSFAYTSTDPDTEEEEKNKKEKRHVILVDQNFKYNHLYTVGIEKAKEEKERKVQRLTRGDFTIQSFDWSPNGKTIVFTHAEDPKINTNFRNSDIALVAADSSAVTDLVDRPGVDTNPKFSQDGSQIIFQSDGGKSEPIGLSDLFSVSAKGGTPRALPHTPDRNANIISWKNDQLWISEPHRTSAAILQMKTDMATIKSKKANPVVISSLNGNSTSAAISQNADVMAFVYQTPDKPAEVYLSKTDGTGLRQISHINDEIELPKMGKTEVIQWKSKDGMDVEGILTYPVDYEPGKKYPVILQIHGGPAGVFTKSFTGGPSIYMTQYFAEKGFAVIRPNPRGSTGYGKDFRYANFMDWGYGDYEDVMSGVDKVLEMGIGDTNDMYVMGWSYGGYMTSFLVTRTDRFKAASMGAGLPNLLSMVTTTDIPDYLVGHMGGEFWNDYDTYEKHSAMYHIKNVKTPTQVIHGANDLRVPFTQGQEFYVALKRRGIPTEMIVLPRTPHGPREPKLLMEVSPRILSWYEQHRTVKP